MGKPKGCIVTRSQLRELGKHLLDNEVMGDVWTPEPEIANVSAVVDPQADDTVPVNPSFVPQDKVEFEVAVRNLVRTLPNDKIPELFTTLQRAIKASSSEANEEFAMKQDDKNAKLDKVVEEAIRRKVRQLISEIRPLANYPGGAGFWGEKGGDEERDPNAKKYTIVKDVGGDPLKPIAKATGRAVAGVKRTANVGLSKIARRDPDIFNQFQSIEPAIKQYISNSDLSMSDEEFGELSQLKTDLEMSVKNYVEHLESSGELESDDIAFLKNPENFMFIVNELPGFQDWLMDVDPELMLDLYDNSFIDLVGGKDDKKWNDLRKAIKSDVDQLKKDFKTPAKKGKKGKKGKK